VVGGDFSCSDKLRDKVNGGYPANWKADFSNSWAIPLAAGLAMGLYGSVFVPQTESPHDFWDFELI